MDREGYYGAVGLSDPAHVVTRVAGRAIERAAERHFRGRLIEIGCGGKKKAALVGARVAQHVGLDHPGCQHGTGQVDLLGTAYAIATRSETFDCALSTSVLEHLEEPQAALREAHRVLKPGARAIYTVPLHWHLHEEPRDFYRYTRYGLEHLFRGAGFEIESIEALSGYWTTAAAGLGYYLQRFRRRPLRWLVDATVAVLNLAAPLLDRGGLRDERFTWMYLVVARRPEAASSVVEAQA